MDQTPNLGLPYIFAAQAQKHVTHNEAIRAADALIQIGVVSRTSLSPPASPAEGARYIVPSGGQNAWANFDDQIMAFQDGAWNSYAPKAGWLAWVVDEDQLVVFDGGAWTDVAGGGAQLNPVPLIGVNATADTTNRLAVMSPASLFSHEGAGHQQKINKAAATDTASVLFQTNWSGRAEFGLAGDDDWHVKVSPDGSTWHEALIADRNTGRVRFPSTPSREVLAANRTYYVRTDGNDANTGLANTAGGAFLTIQKAVDVAAALDLSIYDVTIQLAAGTYATASGVRCKRLTGSGRVIILGDEVTPANVVLEATGALTAALGVVYTDGAINYAVRGCRIQANASATGFKLGLAAISGGQVEFRKCDFGANLSAHIFGDTGGIVICTGNYSISAGAGRHVYATAGMVKLAGTTVAAIVVTLTGTPAFSQAFAGAERGAYANLAFMTFSGAATGARYNANYSATIYVQGAGASYLPGDAAGTDNGGRWPLFLRFLP